MLVDALDAASAPRTAGWPCCTAVPLSFGERSVGRDEAFGPRPRPPRAGPRPARRPRSRRGRPGRAADGRWPPELVGELSGPAADGGARDGIPSSAIAQPLTGLPGPSGLRRFPNAELAQPLPPAGHGLPDDAGVFLVLATTDDRAEDRLRAGEALSTVLLTATRAGLATTPLSQATEVAASRDLLRQVVGIPEQPQLVLRIGWPATHAAELPDTPRRDLASVLVHRPRARGAETIMTISVFLLDDHEIVRRGLAQLLETEDDIEVVGEAGTAAQALARIPALRPDVAILDVRLPDGDGVSRVPGPPLVGRPAARLPDAHLVLRRRGALRRDHGGRLRATCSSRSRASTSSAPSAPSPRAARCSTRGPPPPCWSGCAGAASPTTPATRR